MFHCCQNLKSHEACLWCKPTSGSWNVILYKSISLFWFGRIYRFVDGEDEEQDPPAKKQKLSKVDLYKPPSNDEINTLKETENLLQSSLFRMQVFNLWCDEQAVYVKILNVNTLQTLSNVNM